VTTHDASAEQRLEEILPKLVLENDAAAIEKLIEGQSTAELARAVSRLDDEQRGRLIDLIDAESAADLLEQLPSVQAVQLLEEAEPDQAAAAIDELPSDLQADLLAEMDDDDAEAILNHMQPDEALSARQLKQYREDEAGGLMVTELLRYPEQWSVNEVVADLQAGADKYRDYQIQYAYVCTDKGVLLGVLRLRDLLLGDRRRIIREIMISASFDVALFGTCQIASLANTSPQRQQGTSNSTKMYYPLLALRAGNFNRCIGLSQQ
jgi:magnesium transporter